MSSSNESRGQGGRSAGALAGRRVVELADEKGLYCGKLLADMGADVVKVECPGGDPARDLRPHRRGETGPDRSLPFLYLNTSKRSVTLDLEEAADRERFATLVADADLVVETCAPGRLDELGLGYEALSAANARIVVTSITDFGTTGPRSGWRGSDLVDSALGGAMYVTGYPEDPPVTIAGMQAYVAAGTCAAAASVIAMFDATRSGRGQHVDISATEVVTSVSHICGAGKFLSDGIVPKRFGTGLFASVPSGAYVCKDGLVYLMVNRPGHWQALAHWVNEVTGNLEVLDPMFDGPSSMRQPYRELLDLFISELTATMTVDQMYRQAQRRHIAVTPVNTALGVTSDEHLEARGFFVEVAQAAGVTLRYPGPPFRPRGTPWCIRRRAPLPGEHNEEVFARASIVAQRIDGEARRAGGAAVPAPAQQPHSALAGVRVLELTAGMAGPWIGRIMAWCGADVIKVESTGYPDVTRLYVPPGDAGGGIRSTLSPWFTDWNAGKRFVALDLTTAEGVDLCKRLVAKCDVVVENYTPGVLSKLGLDWPALRAANDALVMLSSSGFGQSGPDSRYVTWGPNIEALAAMSSLSGFAHRACTMTQYAYPDPLSALHGLFAVMAALDHRERGGAGQYIDLSQYETSVAAIGQVLMEALALGTEPVRRGNASADARLQGCYRCADQAGDDDRWCAVTVNDDEAWSGLCRVLGRDDLIESDTAVEEILAAWIREHEAEDVMRALQAEGVPAGVVQMARDHLERDEQLAARGHFETIHHHDLGPVRANGVPLGLTATPGRTTDTGRSIGHDNHAVLGELLAMTATEIEALVVRGIVQRAGPVESAAAVRKR